MGKEDEEINRLRDYGPCFFRFGDASITIKVTIIHMAAGEMVGDVAEEEDARKAESADHEFAVGSFVPRLNGDATGDDTYCDEGVNNRIHHGEEWEIYPFWSLQLDTVHRSYEEYDYDGDNRGEYVPSFSSFHRSRAVSIVL